MSKRKWIGVAASMAGGYLLWRRKQSRDYVRSLAFSTPDTYWKNYLPLADAEEVERVVQESYIHSIADIPIHLDIYRQDRPRSTVVFVHGAGGLYARLYARLLLAIYRRGYHVVAPDLAGSGWSGGKRGGMTLGEQVRVIRDTITYALEQFGPPVYLSGASLGGVLTLYTAAADDRLAGIIPYNIADLSKLGQATRISRLGVLVPILAEALIHLGRTVPGFKIPYQIVVRSEHLFTDPQILALFEHDPLAWRAWSLRFICSMLDTKPPRPMSDITVPALVLQPQNDEIFPADLTQSNFNYLGGLKEMILLEGANHFSSNPSFLDEIARVLDRWIQNREAADSTSAG